MIFHKNAVAIFTEPQKIELVNLPITTLKEEDVCVEYLYCGICGGDYSVYAGLRNNFPISLGHEFVGRIVSVGQSVEELKIGQYVVSDFNFRCKRCEYCVSRKSHLCLHNDDKLFSNRGFANYACIHSSYLVPIDPPKYLPRACLIEPLSCVIHASKCSNIHSGMNILISGGGSIGMLFCFLLCNSYKDINIYVNEKNSEKTKKLCSYFNVLPYNKESKNKFDLIIDCSNSVSGLNFSLDTAKRGSNLCIMSHIYGLETSFIYEKICKKELLCVFPLRNGERSNLTIASQLINDLWKKEFDSLLYVYDDIIKAFNEKSKSPHCKQIVKSSSLSIS